MRRIYTIILLSLFMRLSAMAAFHSVNVDKATIAAMRAAYEIENETEQQGLNALDSISNKYTKSNISIAQIFLAEKKRHDALREMRFFDDGEFYYYKRIKYLAADLIMPKLITVAYGMLQKPQNAMYWGPYLYKTTNSVVSLCKQFEVLVTNGKRTFKDVKFLVLNESLERYFDLAKLGNVDWKATLDNLSNFGEGLSWEAVKEDFTNITNTLSAIGGSVIDKNFSQFSNIGRVFHASRDEIKDMYEGFKEAYKIYDNAKDTKDFVMGVVQSADAEGVKKLFRIDDYNIAEYMQGYIDKLQNRYYTQRWYISSINSGSQVLAEYAPESYDSYDDSRWDAAWNHYISPRDNEYCHSLTSSEREEIKRKADTQSGWSQSKVSSYNTQNPGHNCSMSYTLNHVNLRESYKNTGLGHRHYKRHCFYSYNVKVVDSWNIQQVIYEETFDSKTMDKRIFKEKLDARLKHYQDSIADSDTLHSYSFVLSSDSPIYYEEADAQKLSGCTSVTFIAKCQGGTNLGKGSWSWKENDKQGKSLNEESENFAMSTNFERDDSETQLNDAITEKEKQIQSIQNEINSLEEQLSTLSRKMFQANMNGNQQLYKQLCSQYDELKRKQDDLKQQLKDAQNERNELQNAREEYYKDLEETSEEDKYRIPANMDELASAYKIRWLDTGKWDRDAGDHVWIRHGYSESGGFYVTYTANLSLSRKPQYLLGIRIHRAILSIDFSLTSEQASESVIETMKLDNNISEKEQANIVNNRYAELRRDMPDCTIEIQYNRTETVDSGEEDVDGLHLLFASDRIEIARNIESQLADIYSHLIMIERVMYAQNTIENFLRGIVLDLIDSERRKTVVEAALYNWRQSAVKALEGQKGTSKNNNTQKSKFRRL